MIMSSSKRHYSDSSIHSNLHAIDTPPSPSEVSLTRKQLAQEIKLQQSSHDLLLLYQESQNWVAVGEVAQTLNTNKKRIEQLKNQLLSLENGSVVSQPPLLESIREAESPVDTHPSNLIIQQQRAQSPVESVTVKVDQAEDGTNINERAKQEQNKDVQEGESSCSDKEEATEEGENKINHTSPEGTSEKPSDFKDKECPLQLERDTTECSNSSESLEASLSKEAASKDESEKQEPFRVEQLEESVIEHISPPDTQNTGSLDLAKESETDSVFEEPAIGDSKEPQPTVQFFTVCEESLDEQSELPVQPVSDKQPSPLVIQDLQDQPTSAAKQPAVDSPLEISSKPTTTDESSHSPINRAELHVKEPVSNTLADQEESVFEENKVAELLVGEATVEESLEKLVALVDHIQIDLDIAEESLGDIQTDFSEEPNPFVQTEGDGQAQLDIADAKVATPLSRKSRESSLEFEDAINDERVPVEYSDDNSDSFFSPPESPGPLVSESVHPSDSDKPLENSLLEEDGLQTQPQLESITVKEDKDSEIVSFDQDVTVSNFQRKEEEVPVVTSDQGTTPINQDQIGEYPGNQDTSVITQGEDPGNQVLENLPPTTDCTEAFVPTTETAVGEVPVINTSLDIEDPDSQVTDNLNATNNTVELVTTQTLVTTDTENTSPVPLVIEEEPPVTVFNQEAQTLVTSDIENTESVPLVTEEEAPVTVSSQETCDSNNLTDTTDSTLALVTTHTENTTPTESVPLVTEEEVPATVSNQEASDLKTVDDKVALVTTESVPVIPSILLSVDEDTPEIIINQASNQTPAIPTQPPVANLPTEKEETPEITAANREEENTEPNQKMNEIAFTINKFMSPTDNAMYYRIDVRSYDVLFADPELLQHLPVLQTLEDFLKLRKRLESVIKERGSEVEIPELISECNNHTDTTSMENGNGVNEDCEQFEKFLNQVVNDPKLGKEQVLVRFLSGREQSASPVPPDSTPQESLRESPEVLVNGAATDTSEISSADSKPDKDISSSTTTVPTLENTSTLPNDEEVPSIRPKDVGAQSDRDELTFSPNHSERASSTATNSSNIATDDSAPELSDVGGDKLSRSESNPILGDYEVSPDGGDTLHQSLMPSHHKYASSGNILEHSAAEVADNVRNKSRHKRSTMKDKLRKGGRSIARSVSGRKKKRSATLRDPQAEVKGNVTIRRPITSQEWDPTCLLEELYSDFKPGTTITDVSGESARHFGYLEKLPTGQSKASVLKGWKRRYFRAQEGNMYYYEDRTQEKALGFIRLSTARIILIPEKHQIQIVDKGSRSSIMLRAPDSQELLAWHRALELEAVHPTQPAPLSPLFKIENPILIVDIGACSVRAGLSRENAYPEVFLPAVCSLDASTLEILDCGYNALLPSNRYGAHQIYPRKTSLRMDKHDTNLKTKAIDGMLTTILERLDVDPQSTQVLLTHPPTVPEQDRNELAELLFDVFMFDGVCFQEQATLALYSYNTTSGIVVDIGDHIDVVPFIDGYKIENGVSRMLFGGNAITEYLSKLITAKGIRYFSETEVYINRFIMESLCYVSENYDQDASDCDANPADFTRAVDVDRFQLPDHRKVVALDAALFKAPEGLFRPGLWGKDVPSLPELVWKAIQACPIDQRREMAKKIYLSGATTLLPGLQERLQKELSAMSPGGLTIEVHAAPTRHHAAYLGASVLAGLSSFQSYLVTQEDWNVEGIDALRKWGGT